MSNTPDKPNLVRRDTLQALTRLRAPRGSDWCVFAYVLNHDIINAEGKADDLRAVVFPLGAFDEEARADKHAKSIIELTGHPGIIVARYASGIPLTAKFDATTVVEVPVDKNGKLVELESAQYKHEREEYERRIKREEDMQREAQAEVNPNDIEHFKRHCYLAIRDRAAYEHSKKQMEDALANYKKHEKEVRNHYVKHPEHEEQWLPYLKKKLAERGEETLYNTVANGYNKLRDELLGPVLQQECNDDICLPPPATAVATAITTPKTPVLVDTEQSDDDELIARAVK